MDYLKLGSPEKAIPFLQQALKLDRSNRSAREALASSYLGQDNFRGAAEQFRQLAADNPDKPGALFKLGHEYLDMAARLAYRGAHLYRESAWGHRFLGDLLLQRGRSEDAGKEYQKALSIQPQQTGLHSSLGQAYLHGQKLEETETEFHRELQVDSRSELAWMGLANLALAKSQATAALECLRKVWGISPEFLAVQREFPSMELPQEAAKASILRVKDEPEGAAKNFLLSGLYAAANESARADHAWKSFQNDFSEWQKTSNAAGTRGDQAPCKAHRYSRCIDSLEARKRLTDSERILLGRTYFVLRQYELAANALAQVQGATSANAEASYWLSRTYQMQGAEAYARLQESFPDSWRAHQLRAEDRSLHRDPDAAVKEFHVALQLRPNEPELHEALGELYLDNQDDDNAQTELEKALSLDPSRAHTLYLLGRLYLKKQENDKAVSYLQRALHLQPDMAEASSLLGRVYIRLGQFANAIPRLEKAAPSDHYGNVHYQLYLAYRKLGQMELAQKELARSQDLRRSSLEGDQALVMGSPQPEPEAQ
jgi:tetratricopeptide (TPR) repeat protein